jgi:hypothetical protein
MSQADVVVEERERDRDRLRYHVAVGSREFQVTVREEDAALLAPGVEPRRLVAESFQFLLEREPVSSIMASFDLTVIERYFPEYRREIGVRSAQ